MIRLRSLAHIAVVSFALIPLSIAVGADETISVKENHSLSTVQANFISNSGVAALGQIAEARRLIHAKSYTGAQNVINSANSMFEEIRAQLPTYTVLERVNIAKRHLDFEEAAAVVPDLIPLYTELDAMTGIVPTQDAKAHLDKAKGHLAKNNKKGAVEELKLVTEGLVYSEIDLPLNKTQEFVNTASTELQAKKYLQADASLKKAEGTLQEKVISIVNGMRSKPASSR